MSNKGTLLDLKKFRFGRRSHYEISENKGYNLKLLNHIPGINESFSLPYHRNIDLNPRKTINYGAKIAEMPNYIANVNAINQGIAPPNLLGNRLPKKVPESNLPDFIIKNQSYNNIIINKKDPPLLKKARLEILKNDENKQQAFTFAWEAFPVYTPTQIYLALDYFDWNLDHVIPRLANQTLDFDSVQLDPMYPTREIEKGNMKRFLEESEDEFMEDDDSQERFARAELDSEEYNFVMDHAPAPPPLGVPLTPPGGPSMTPASPHGAGNLYSASYRSGIVTVPAPVPGGRRSMTDYFLDTFNRKAGIPGSTGYRTGGPPSYRSASGNFRSPLDGTPDPDHESGALEIMTEPLRVSKGSGPRTNARTLTDREALVDFFNTATREELMGLKHCTLKKCTVITEQRPFTSWEELNAKFERFKFLSVDLIQSAKKVLYLRKQIVKLLQHCEQLSNELQMAVDKMAQGTMVVQPSKSITEAGHVLKPYQIAGMNWLNLLYKMGMNGILADEMGLGKTVQLLAFLQSLLEAGTKGPFLIIVPASTLDNWASEISIWCPDARFTTYYGSQSERKDQRNQLLEEQGIDTWDIILTTYSMVSSTTDDKNFFKRISFTYIVFDEAHMLKNMASVRYKYLLKIKARFRVLMTGTPIQNNLLELMSLLQFVLPNLFEDRTEELKTLFSAYDLGHHAPETEARPGGPGAEDEDLLAEEAAADSTRPAPDNSRSRSDFERARIAQAKHVVRPFVLRRLKSQVLDQLPPKRQEVTLCELPPEQAALYGTILDEYKVQVREQAKTGPALPPMSVMMKLRKVANHPLLFRSLYTEDLLRQMADAMINEPTHKQAVPDLIFEDMKVLNDFELYKLTKAFPSIGNFKLASHVIKDSAKFRYLDTSLPQIVGSGEKALIFSQFTQMLDILQEYLALSNMTYMRIDGTTPVPDRLTLIKKFTTDPECHIFLLSTKAGGLGINLTCANHVIIHDIDINPYNDKQAEDRCHRVGQEKTVLVNRLIAKNTVEEIILRYNQEKLKLEESMTGVAPGTLAKSEPTTSGAGMVFAAGEDVFATDYEADLAKAKADSTDENNEEIANLLKIALG